MNETKAPNGGPMPLPKWPARVVPILLLAGAAAAPRFYHLSFERLWGDEAYSRDMAVNAWHAFWGIVRVDSNPPFYLLLLRAWVRLFGTNEAGLRSLSALLGVAGVGAMYALGRELGGKKAGWWAAATMTFSLMHIYYSQEARMYSLLVLSAALSGWMLLRLLRTGRNGYIAGYAVTLAAMAYTHYFALFFFLAQLVYAVVFLVRRRDLAVSKKYAGACAAAAVMYLPWLPTFWLQVHTAKPWMPPITAANLKFYATQSFGTWFAFELWAAALLVALVTAAIWARRTTGWPLLLAVLFAAFPFFLPFIISYAWKPVFLPRYVILALVGVSLIAGLAIASIRRTAVRGLFGVAVVLCMSWGLPTLYAEPHRPQWREAVAYVEGAAKPSELLVFYQRYQKAGFGLYQKRTDFAYEGFPAHGMVTDEKAFAELKADLTGRDSFWLISVTDPPTEEKLLSFLKSSYVLVHTKNFFAIDVYYFARSEVVPP